MLSSQTPRTFTQPWSNTSLLQTLVPASHRRASGSLRTNSPPSFAVSTKYLQTPIPLPMAVSSITFQVHSPSAYHSVKHHLCYLFPYLYQRFELTTGASPSLPPAPNILPSEPPRPGVLLRHPRNVATQLPSLESGLVREIYLDCIYYLVPDPKYPSPPDFRGPQVTPFSITSTSGSYKTKTPPDPHRPSRLTRIQTCSRTQSQLLHYRIFEGVHSLGEGLSRTPFPSPGANHCA